LHESVQGAAAETEEGHHFTDCHKTILNQFPAISEKVKCVGTQGATAGENDRIGVDRTSIESGAKPAFALRVLKASIEHATFEDQLRRGRTFGALEVFTVSNGGTGGGAHENRRYCPHRGAGVGRV